GALPHRVGAGRGQGQAHRRRPAGHGDPREMSRVALVTGASSGFGRATVERFVAGGWRVVACGRRAERLHALVDALGADQVHVAAFDIRDAAAMRAALDALPDDFRGINLLVNNAGLALGTRPAQEASLDDWRTMIETNVTALVTLTHALLPTLIERRGAIVNVSSTAAKYPYTGGNVYGRSEERRVGKEWRTRKCEK